MSTATIQSGIKRGLLNSLARAAAKNGVTLKETLESFQDGIFASVKTGRLVISHSGSGHSTSFEIPSVARGFSPDQLFGLTQEFLEILEDAGGTEGTFDSAADAATLATMLADDRLQGISEVREDYLLLRTPSTFGPAQG